MDHIQQVARRLKGLRDALDLSVEEIAEAWIYWESRGLVRIMREKDSNNEEVNHIFFLSKIYGKNQRRYSSF